MLSNMARLHQLEKPLGRYEPYPDSHSCPLSGFAGGGLPVNTCGHKPITWKQTYNAHSRSIEIGMEIAIPEEVVSGNDSRNAKAKFSNRWNSPVCRNGRVGFSCAGRPYDVYPRTFPGKDAQRSIAQWLEFQKWMPVMKDKDT